MAILTVGTVQIFEYILDHIQVLGWAGLGILAWKGRGYIDRFLAGVELSDTRLQETQSTVSQALASVKEVKAGVDVIQTNHLAHVEKDLGTLSVKQDQANQILTSIDKSISILVDRGRV